jgi:hypothetical protein
MYVYIWKDPNGVPFYVGMGSTLGRTNPKAKCHRNKGCLQKLADLGADSVVVEIHTVANADEAKSMEQMFIAKFGRIRDGGTLTNISAGGEFHKTSDETKQKLVDLWKTPEYRTATIDPRVGKTRDLTESTKEVLRANLLKNEHMKSWGERNGKDPEFDAKRIEGIRDAQGKRREKMSDPVALAQRKERLKATMASPEYAAKRAAFDTPEYRAKLAAAKKAYWDKRKGLI